MIHIRKQFSLLVIVISMLSAGTYSCQMDKTDNPDKEISSSGIKLESNIADMISSMNLYTFEEIVKAPDFELVSVKGDKVSLGQHRGKVVLLSFWATW